MAFDLVNIPIKPSTNIYKQKNTYCFRLSAEIDSKLMIGESKTYNKTFVFLTITSKPTCAEAVQKIESTAIARFKNVTNASTTSEKHSKNRLQSNASQNKFTTSEKNSAQECTMQAKTDIQDFNYKISIHSATSEIYEFNQPVDFLLPCNTQYYHDFYDKLVFSDVDTLLKTDFRGEPPFYCVPNLSLIKPYKSLPVYFVQSNIGTQNSAVYYDWSGEEVPTTNRIEYMNEMKQRPEHDFVITFLQKAFSEQKICDKTHSKISYKNFCEYWKKNYNVSRTKTNDDRTKAIDNKTNEIYGETKVKEVDGCKLQLDGNTYEIKRGNTVKQLSLDDGMPQEISDDSNSNPHIDTSEGNAVDKDRRNAVEKDACDAVEKDGCNTNRRSTNSKKSSFKPLRKREKDQVITKHAYFSYLPLVAYHTLKGPWARCWIQFGYDPRKDYKNYAYQRLTKYKFPGLVNFLKQDFVIYNILVQNEKKYVTKKYSEENGFFKKEFIQFLRKYCKKKNIEKITHKEESEESCFDIL